MVFQQASKEYQQYNKIKIQSTKDFLIELTPLAEDISNEIDVEISEWVTRKQPNISQSSQEDDNTFNATDILFLIGILAIINQYSSEFASTKYQDSINKVYDKSVQYYTDLEANKIQKAVGHQPRPQHTPQLNHSDPTIRAFYNDYSLKAFSEIGQKYYPVIQKIIVKGYSNNTSITTIARQIQQAVDPYSKGNKISYIYERIARTEMAFYSEVAKTDTWNSFGIQQAQLITRMDRKVCPICRPLHGRVYLISEIGTVIPYIMHANCRCSWVPFYDPNNLDPLLFLPFLTDKED